MKVKSFQVSERGPIILLRFVTEQDDSENRWKSCKLPKQQSNSGYKTEWDSECSAGLHSMLREKT